MCEYHVRVGEEIWGGQAASKMKFAEE